MFLKTMSFCSWFFHTKTSMYVWYFGIPFFVAVAAAAFIVVVVRVAFLFSLFTLVAKNFSVCMLEL